MANRPKVYEGKEEKILALFRKGKGIAAVAKLLDISCQRVHQLEIENPSFLSVMNKGRSLSLQYWEDLGQKNLKNKKLNTQLYTLFMNNKFGWGSKHHVETTGQHTSKLEISFDSNIVDSVIDKILESDN